MTNAELEMSLDFTN